MRCNNCWGVDRTEIEKKRSGRKRTNGFEISRTITTTKLSRKKKSEKEKWNAFRKFAQGTIVRGHNLLGVVVNCIASVGFYGNNNNNITELTK